MSKTTIYLRGIILIACLLTCAGLAIAADVRLEQLADFDRTKHAIAVNVEVKVSGPCRPDVGQLASAYEQLLELMGYRLAPLNDSDLEFAVFSAGFSTSGPQQCGIKLLSMVRQVPTIRVLRLPPGSGSSQYRLWEAEHLITGEAGEMTALLGEQVREDVVSFQREFEAARR
jgi:hypothetical protein